MWTSLSIVIVVCLVDFVWTANQPLILHEKRESGPDTWVRQRIEADVLLPMRIGLTQSPHALQNAERWLMEVSDPDSLNYGQHWKQEEVITAFQPSPETVRAVTDWLHSYGIIDFTHSDNKLWFAFDLPANKAEYMLKTEYFEYQTYDKATGELGGFEAFCDQYYLPTNLKQHIDYIVPGVKSGDVSGRTERSKNFLRDIVHEKHFRHVERDNSVSIHKLTEDKDDLTDCDKRVTPACIRALYNIPLANPQQAVSPNNTLGIFEALHWTYDQENLDEFYKRWTDIPIGTEPIFVPVDGGPYPANTTHGPNWRFVEEEPNLDVDAAIPIIYPQNVTMWDMSRDYINRSPLNSNYWNRFFDAIDGSYCTQQQRANSEKGGKPRCGVFKPTNVISASWSFTQEIYTVPWQRRQCNEYLKLGLQGISMFVSSGDNGVGYAGPTPKHLCLNGTNNFRQFVPFWPPACPWLTSVGGTEIGKGKTVYDREEAYQTNGLKKYGSQGGTGGGFGWFPWERPSYQDAAVEHYFKTDNPPWPYFYNGGYKANGTYNRNGRGYPDISAVGKHFACCNRNYCALCGGTSVSCPIVAGIFNRINEERIRVGKGPVGFVNPVLYKNPDALNDIVTGQNGECGPNTGFNCTIGWDPVTGLGTPNYQKLLNVFMKLP